MARVSTVFLDVMDTLVKDPFFDVAPRFFGVPLATLFHEKDPQAWIDFECGQISESEYFRRAFRDGRKLDGCAYREAMFSAYRWLDGMEALLQELCEREVKLFALSNYPSWYLQLDQRLGVSRYLSWDFVSCATGVRKPDPAAYQGPLSALELSPSSCVFVDDRLQNCEAAERVGIRSHPFVNAEALRHFLREANVL